MSSYYFETKERQDILEEELKKWMGAPWRHHSCSINGTDCVGMVYGVWCKIGLFSKEALKIPSYPRDWHNHNKEELLIKFLKNIEFLEQIQYKQNSIINGDIVVFKYGNTGSHIGIYFNKNIYHCPTNLYVIASPFNEHGYFKRIHSVFRCMEIK